MRKAKPKKPPVLIQRITEQTHGQLEEIKAATKLSKPMIVETAVEKMHKETVKK